MQRTDIEEHSYTEWLKAIKQKVQTAKERIIRTANAELLSFYWQLGKEIALKLKENNWGEKTIDKLSVDLRKEFPDSKGFSRQNLYYMKQFYEYYRPIVPHSEGQFQTTENQIIFDIPWGHQKVIISRTHSTEEALFYVKQTLDNGWKRETLENQIKQHLYDNIHNKQTNFANTLPVQTAGIAQEVVKDPYWFDFVSVSQKAYERDIEKQLVTHITQFLLELGKGFAFVGEQYCLRLNEKEYFCDLLFYHIPLKAYVVIELKNCSFKPEHLGQLNFYQNIINGTLKGKDDNSTIGMLLCRDKDRIEVEYALQNMIAPMGVSEFNVRELSAESLKSQLPTIEEVEKELEQFIEK